MNTEYLKKCWHLFNWLDASDMNLLYSEMEEASKDPVGLSILFSNELIANLMEASSREHMERVVETYLAGLSVASHSAKEFSSNLDASAIDRYINSDSNSDLIERMGLYLINTNTLLDLLMTEIKLVCVVYEIEPIPIIHRLSGRYKKKGFKEIDFLEDYIYQESEENSFKVIEPITWYGEDEKLMTFLTLLIDEYLIEKANITELINYHFKDESNKPVASWINWYRSKALLSYLAQGLGMRHLIPFENRFAIMEKHFMIKGKPVTKLSLSYYQSMGNKSKKIGGCDRVDAILAKL